MYDQMKATLVIIYFNNNLWSSLEGCVLTKKTISPSEEMSVQNILNKAGVLQSCKNLVMAVTKF